MSVKCPNCAGNLLFSPSRQAMFCRMCGSTFAPEDVGTDVHASPTYECNIYTCSSCGGEVAVSGTETSSVCLYCGSPTLMFNRLSSRTKPDGVLPFKITQKEAYDQILKHLKGGKFVPSGVTKINQDDIRGIYLPYRLMSGYIHDAVAVSSTIGSGKYSKTIFTGIAGTAEFSNMPCDATTSLNNDYARKIEPFYFDDIKDFDEDYLSGFYSDIQDETGKNLEWAVKNRCDKIFCDKCKGTVRGRDPKVFESVADIRLKDEGLYLLMPCWFYTFVYDGKPYTLLVNGQTGKTAGTIPWDKKRLIKISLGMFAGMFAVMAVPVFFPTIVNSTELNSIITSIMFYFFLPLAVTFTIIGSVRMKAIKQQLALTRDSRVFKFVKERQG